MNKEVLYDEPRIVLYHDVFSKDECTDLIEGVPPDRYFAAEGFDFATKTGIPTEYRSNSTYVDREYRLVTLQDRLTKLIEEELVGTPHNKKDCIELPLQLQKYDVGQQYKKHVDFFNRPNEPKIFSVERVASAIVYLNDGFEGGETHFTTLNIKVTPKAGMALFFRYDYNDPYINMNTFHAALPVSSGAKYIITAFIRSEPLKFGNWNPIIWNRSSG